jgi:hypothetical protein
MKNYNYANEIIKEYDEPNATSNYKRFFISGDFTQEPIKSIKNVDNENAAGMVKGFKEGLRNDNASNEEKA